MPRSAMCQSGRSGIGVPGTGAVGMEQAGARRRGVRDAMIRHKKDGLPVVIYRDGKSVWVNPEDVGY